MLIRLVQRTGSTIPRPGTQRVYVQIWAILPRFCAAN